ncbi:MAG: di-trans,poly-cis-decaprenylcistransferase [Burkholderiales bacterium]|nr:di-trans,poly-cis-decaprenylcistransferase [Anaerolineae bacterium]
MAAAVPEKTDTPILEPDRVPKHVAIIMDGNGRWAKSHGLPRTEGHRRGTDNLRRILESSVEFGIEILTIYAFSTENWRRPPLEVRLLMGILEMVIDRELKELHANGVQIRHIGEMDGIDPKLQRKILYACDYTKDNTRLILNVAFNYGGRDEIVHAVRRIINAGIPADQVDAALIGKYLYTGDLPDPDLIIRTSGELRVSNFLIWQGAYSEYYATSVYWPDFSKEELHKALVEYGHRKRRFGQTDDQLEAEE